MKKECFFKKTYVKNAIKIFVIASFITFMFTAIANAAMPLGTENPFTTAQTAIQSLIENAITLGKWLAMASMVVCALCAFTGRFNKDHCIKLALIMAAFSGLGWIIDLFMGNN
ncbi:MAG: hypothetical protein MJ247_06320 [Alphaproteobacteria bacterium]|nr:hypothetical protein [Alphaproteobacteria bacterium]